jgi:hypothetical protein
MRARFVICNGARQNNFDKHFVGWFRRKFCRFWFFFLRTVEARTWDVPTFLRKNVRVK